MAKELKDPGNPVFGIPLKTIRLRMVPPTVTHQAGAKILKNWDTGKLFVGRPKNSRAEAAKRQLSLELRRFRPRKPFYGALALHVMPVFPFRKADVNRYLPEALVPKDTIPDCSNWIKLLEDCMTQERFWKDDCQISDLFVQKRWGKDPRIEIRIYQSSVLFESEKLFL